MGALQIPDMIWYDTAKRLTQRISAKLCTQSTWKQQHPLTCRSSWSEYTCTLFSSENQWSGQLLSKFWGLYNKQTNKTHTHTCTHAHTHTHRLNGPLSRTTRVSQYQKGKPNLDFTEARDSEWQWAIRQSAPCSKQTIFTIITSLKVCVGIILVNWSAC